MEGGNGATNGSAVTLSPLGEHRELGVIGEPGTLVPGLTELIGYRYYTHGLTPVARLLGYCPTFLVTISTVVCIRKLRGSLDNCFYTFYNMKDELLVDSFLMHLPSFRRERFATFLLEVLLDL